VSEDLHRRMFVGDVHGGTIVYRKEIWQKLMKYPAVNLAEDAALIKRAIECGRRLLRIENNGEFVYVRHGGNAWRFQSGQFLAPGGWQRVSAPPEFSAALLADYLAASHSMRLSAPPVTRRSPQYARI
jgi:O-antigen biosynthesis protein